MSAPRCLLCVHAHPDDEALFTAGVMARYANEGVRSVLVTCTDGSLGFAPDGTAPHADGHDRSVVARARRTELEDSARVLGVDRLEWLGFEDSGMAGWPENALATSFVNQPIDKVADRIADVIVAERPQVVVTYDSNGFYGHPDHIATHDATIAALDRTGVVEKVYFPAIPTSMLAAYLELAREMGLVLPEWLQDPDWGVPDELVRTEVDCSAYVARKHDALAAHATQTDNADLVGLPEELFALVFGTERFVRAFDSTGTALPEDDLFAGVR